MGRQSQTAELTSVLRRTHQDVGARAVRAVASRDAPDGEALQLVVALAQPPLAPEHGVQPVIRDTGVMT